MQTKRAAGLTALAFSIALGGCWGQENREQTAVSSPSPASSYSAFWKKEKTGGTTTAVASGPTGQVKPGWAKLPLVEEERAEKGAKLFDTKGCAACHTFGKGKIVGPDLKGVTHRVEPEWMSKWLADPAPMLQSDPYAKQMLATYLVQMPNQQIKPAEAKALIESLRQRDAGEIASGEHGEHHKDKKHKEKHS